MKTFKGHKISFGGFEADNDMAFHIRSYNLKNSLAAWFKTPARFSTDDYVISHGKKANGAYYFDVWFADLTQALLFKLSN